MKYRIGQGLDIHPFAAGRRLVLGGVEIPHSRGLEGHSDADALLHALTDALLGAAGLGDIGTHFPNTDEAWKGASSRRLLTLAWQKISALGWKIENLDMTLLAEEPKISPYISAMKQAISESLSIDVEQIGIKASTTERLGFVGRGEGVLASCVALLSCEV